MGGSSVPGKVPGNSMPTGKGCGGRPNMAGAVELRGGYGVVETTLGILHITQLQDKYGVKIIHYLAHKT